MGGRILVDEAQITCDLVKFLIPYRQRINATAIKYMPNKIKAAESDFKAGNTQLDQLNIVCPSMAAKILPFVFA